MEQMAVRGEGPGDWMREGEGIKQKHSPYI